MRLLATKDFASITVDEIVHFAKTSKGSFYFRFATKAHLLRYLAEETFTELSRESRGFFLAEETRKLTLAGFLEAFIDLVATAYAERRNLLRAFLEEARPGGDEVVVTLVRAGSAESARMLLDALWERRNEIKHPNAAVAISTTAIVLGVTLRNTFLYPEQVSTLPGITDEQLRVELKHMLWGYLHPRGARKVSRNG